MRADWSVRVRRGILVGKEDMSGMCLGGFQGSGNVMGGAGDCTDGLGGVGLARAQGMTC